MGRHSTVPGRMAATWAGGLGAAGALLVLVAAAAFACAPLATLELDRGVAGAGEHVHVEGKGFLTAGTGEKVVDVRWNSADGPVLASTPSDAQGRISVTFTVPDAEPGYYVLLAGLRDGTTPARAVLQIPGARTQAPAEPVAAGPGSTRGVAGGAALVALGMVGVGLALGGLAFALAGRRRAVERAAVPS